MAEKKSTAKTASEPTAQARTAMAAYNMAVTELGMNMPRGTVDNFEDINNSLINSTARMNNIMPTIIEKIVTDVMQKPKYAGSLGVFVAETQEFGNPLEELIQQPGIEYAYDPDRPDRELSREGEPDIRAAYHMIDRDMQYPLFVDTVQMKTAVTDWDSFGQYLTGLVETHILFLRNMSRQKYFGQLLTAGYLNGATHRVLTQPIEENETVARRFVKQIKTYASKMKSPQRWNEAGVLNVNEDTNTLYLVTTPEVWAEVEVEVQSMSYNVELVSTNIEPIIIDGFPHPAPQPGQPEKVEELQAMLIDRKFVRYSPQYEGTGVNNLASTRGIKMIANDRGRGYYSPFRNAVAWTTELGQQIGKLVNFGKPGVIVSSSRPLHEFEIGVELFKGAPAIDPSAIEFLVDQSDYNVADAVTTFADGKWKLTIQRAGVPRKGARASITVHGSITTENGQSILVPFTVLVQEGV